MPKVVVVGGGPAGCATALRLARHPSIHVSVLEKRPLQSLIDAGDAPRAYPMVLSGRAMATLNHLELDLPSTSEPYHGIRFLPGENVMKLGDQRLQRLVSRTQLSLDMLRAAAQHPNISIHFSTTPAALDLSARRLSVISAATSHDASQLVIDLLGDGVHGAAAPCAIRDLHSDAAPIEGAVAASATDPEDSAAGDLHRGQGARAPVESYVGHGGELGGSRRGAARSLSTNVATEWSTALALSAAGGRELPEEIEYDLLVAADGASSQVRGMLADMGELTVTQTYSAVGGHSNGYKTFTDVVIPESVDAAAHPFAAPDVEPRLNLFFINSADKSKPVKVVCWRSDSDHLCGMVPCVPRSLLAGPVDLPFLQSLFGHALPDWMLSQMMDQLNAQPVNGFGAIRECSQLHAAGGVVLLGDAGHCVTSGLGQGCNMALESVQVFGDLVDECVRGGRDLASVPAAFTAVRKPDVAAMQRLERMSVSLNVSGAAAHAEEHGSVPSGPLAEADAKFKLGSAMLIGFAQWKLMPQRFSTVPMYAMLYDKDTPYRDVLAYVERTARVMYAVCGAILASVGYNLVQVVQN